MDKSKVKIIIAPWPFGYDAAFCLNFDYLSPFCFYNFDSGGNLNEELWKQQEEILSNSPYKITHFVVPKYIFFLPLNSKLSKVINFPTFK